MELCGIEQYIKDSLVIPRKGDCVRWRTHTFSRAYREGIVEEVSLDPFDGLTFTTVEKDGHSWWGYVGLIESINGEAVHNVECD